MDALFDAFLGPQGENERWFRELVDRVVAWQVQWRKTRFPEDPSVYTGRDERSPTFKRRLEEALDEFLSRMERNIPFPSPRYTGQMLKDPGLPALLAYFATMMINPNNHAYEGGPVTTEMEMEVVEQLKQMVGMSQGWGHLTSGGTLANMEALWAVRDTLPPGKVVFSVGSHYSWKRICSILGVDDWHELPVDRQYRMDLNALEDVLRQGRVTLVVANFGTTGTGSVDPLPEILDLRQRYGFHLHVDAAYGGYLRSALLREDGQLLAPEETGAYVKPEVRAAAEHLGQADSMTIDPHKHGLVMYGAGGVLYRDEKFRQTILNTAPYTYHVKEKPNIGMFTLEGSRPGAAAAAVWLTHRVLPLNISGLGQILRETLTTGREFAARLTNETSWQPLVDPDLDIVCFHPKDAPADPVAANHRALDLYRGLSVENPSAPFILSKFVVDPATARTFLGTQGALTDGWTTLRAVFIKHWMRLGPKPTALDRLLEEVAKF
ncbi:MAG: aminotransferase class V-fold PLP-dependent enzyme [Calditrichaeota bacterium]|nr:aminotransferase class V-fold PLP-dependent enzyme [Calditrichota bacterium]